MTIRSLTGMLKSVLSTLAIFVITACNDSGSGNPQQSADDVDIPPASSEPMTTIDAAFMMQNYVTPNVTSIRVVSTDEAENVLSTQLLPRDEAVSFTVLTAAAKVEMGLLTEAEKQIGLTTNIESASKEQRAKANEEPLSKTSLSKNNAPNGTAALSIL